MRAVIESVHIDDPHETDANYLEAKKRDASAAGKIWVARNRITQIGGLAFIRKREAHHERAAEKFLNLYQARYGRMSPAIDAGKVRVDTSIIGHDGEMVEAIDRTRGIELAEVYLGKSDFNRIVAVVCLGINCEDKAPRLPSGKPNWRHVEREVNGVLYALDRLAEHWGMVSRRVEGGVRQTKPA